MNGELLAGRYRLVDLIGRGGAGEVWRAEDQVLARQVAVKLLRSVDGDPMAATDRFRAEAQAAARLIHPNVVATYDVGAADGQVFLVMELVGGHDLAHLLRNGGLPPAKLVTDIAIQAARALDAAHAAGIVHRDVKPANFLLAADSTLKITDFGIARAGEQTAAETVLLGTAAYVAPEQVRGEAATPATDWYGLGCVLYELLAGRPPYTGDTVEEVLRQHIDVQADPTAIQRSDVSGALTDLVLRLLAKEPGDRPASAADVIGLINRPERALAGPANATRVLPMLSPAPEPEEEPTERRRAFPFAKVLVGASVVLAGLVIAALLRAGVSDNTADAGSKPSVPPAVKATSAPKPTPTPTKTPTKTTPKPKQTTQTPVKVGPETLRTLAGLVRDSQQGRGAKAARDAAKKLDEAADALAEGDAESAAEKVREARRRLLEAQREDRWQATPQIATLFATVTRALPASGDGDNE